MSDIKEIANYFSEILNIPSYYNFCIDLNKDPKGKSGMPDLFSKYAIINDINIYICQKDVPYCFLKDDKTVINSHIFLNNSDFEYELLTPIDDYILLIINDIIKYFKGVIL